MIERTTHSAIAQAWLYRLSKALHFQRLNEPNILRTSLSLICSALEVSDGCIVTFEEDGGTRDAYVIGGGDEEIARELWDHLLQQGLAGFVQHGQRIINLRNIAFDPRWSMPPAHINIGRQGSAVGVPLMFQNRMYGALLLLHPEIDYFNEVAVDFLDEASGMIAVAIENAARFTTALNAPPQTQQTRQIEQLRRDLTAMTYHDLRGPIQNVYTSLTALERMSARNGDAMGSEMVRLAMRSSRHMARMVKSLLDIERLEEGRAVVNKRETTLANVVEEVVDLCRQLAEEAEQTLDGSYPDDLPTLLIDPDMITRVLINLVENAIKHTPSGGSIHVGARMTREGVCLTVRDSGPGIPRKFREEIFDKYFRIKHQDAPSGVGLGLAFCRLAVEAHGGRIWVESEPGSGATFAFTLPVEATAAAAALR